MATRDYSEGLPFALMRWIKAQIAKEEAHQKYWATRNAVLDEHYLFYLSMVADAWGQLSRYEKEMVIRLTEWKHDGKNFRPGQKSVIGSLYAKYVLEANSR